MTLELTTEQEQEFLEIARLSGRSAQHVLTEAALWLIHIGRVHDERLRVSLEQADRGEFIEEAEMDARFERMIHPR